MKAVDVLKQYGAKDVIVAVTHGLLSGPALDRINGCDDLKSVIVSDSISQDTKRSKCLKLQVYSLAPLLSDVIARLANGSSISELFE